MAAGCVLAVDLGGTNIRAAAVREDGTIVARVVRDTPARAGPQAVVAAIAEACRAAALGGAVAADAPVGLCAPGPLDGTTGTALATPTIAGFRDFALRAAVAETLGRTVLLDNDGHAGAYGEWRHGAARGARDFVFVTISTGIGGGIVCDGRLLRGRRGLAGHIGHMLVGAPGDLCPCGARGCWEATASGSALQRRARAAGYDDLQAVFAAARLDDAQAFAFLDTAARDIARGLVTLAHVFSPDLFVLAGGVMREFDTLSPLIARHLSVLCLPPFRQVVLRRAGLGDNAGLVGMAMLALADRRGATPSRPVTPSAP